jgi:hypothetical protein
MRKYGSLGYRAVQLQWVGLTPCAFKVAAVASSAAELISVAMKLQLAAAPVS